MSLYSIPCKLFRQLFDISLPLLIIIRFWVLRILIRNIALSPVGILTASELVESGGLSLKEVLRGLSTVTL